MLATAGKSTLVTAVQAIPAQMCHSCRTLQWLRQWQTSPPFATPGGQPLSIGPVPATRRPGRNPGSPRSRAFLVLQAMEPSAHHQSWWCPEAPSADQTRHIPKIRGFRWPSIKVWDLHNVNGLLKSANHGFSGQIWGPGVPWNDLLMHLGYYFTTFTDLKQSSKGICSPRQLLRIA